MPVPSSTAPTSCPPESRVFKVVQSSLAAENLTDDPTTRWQLSSFDLFDTIQTPDGPTTLACDFASPTAPVAEALRKLCGELRAKLQQIALREQARPSGYRVFLGPAFSKVADERFKTLRRELLLQGHHVQSASPLPFAAETEAEHVLRVETALSQANLAVHFMPEQLPPHGNWHLNHAALQLRQSGLRTGLVSFVWHDPNLASFDAQCNRELPALAALPGAQIVKGKNFSDLIVNVKDHLVRLRDVRPHVDPDIAFDVVIEHHDDDSLEAARIRDYINSRGCRAQLTNATVPRKRFTSILRSNREQYYPRARRFVVLYGQTDGAWANDVCNAMRSFIARATRRPGLVITGPPPGKPLSKTVFQSPYDEFETRQCADGHYDPVLEEWLEGPCR